MNTGYIYTTHFPSALLSPLASASFCSPFAPFAPLLLTWNPPCCDRIRPPWPQVARKLTLPFPSPGSFTPHSKILTPRSFPTPNIHSLGQQCEPSSQDRAHLLLCTRMVCYMFLHLLVKNSTVYENRVQIEDQNIFLKVITTGTNCLCSFGPNSINTGTHNRLLDWTRRDVSNRDL